MKQLSIIPDDGFVIVARERSQQKSEHIGIDNAGCVTLSRQVAKRFWKMPVLLIFKRGFTDICHFPAPEGADAAIVFPKSGRKSNLVIDGSEMLLPAADFYGSFSKETGCWIGKRLENPTAASSASTRRAKRSSTRSRGNSSK